MKRCLNENEVARCAEWLADFEDVELEEVYRKHLEECSDCRKEVFEVWEIIRLIQEM